MITVDLFDLIKFGLGALLVIGMLVLYLVREWRNPDPHAGQRYNPVTQRWEDDP